MSCKLLRQSHISEGLGNSLLLLLLWHAHRPNAGDNGPCCTGKKMGRPCSFLLQLILTAHPTTHSMEALPTTWVGRIGHHHTTENFVKLVHMRCVLWGTKSPVVILSPGRKTRRGLGGN